MSRRNFLKNNPLATSTFRVLLALIIAIVISVFTTDLATKITTKRVRHLLELEIKSNARQNSILSSAAILSSTFILHSSVCSFSSTKIEFDSTLNDYSIYHIIDKEQQDKLNVEDLQNLLISFITYNDNFSSASLIFEPGIVRDAPERGIAMTVYTYNDTLYDLLDDRNIFKDSIYDKVRNCHSEYQDSYQLTEKSDMAIFMAISLIDEEGNNIGQFWVTINADFYTDNMASYSRHQDILVSIIDKNHRILLANVHKYNDISLFDPMLAQEHGFITREWLQNAVDSLALNKNCFFRLDAPNDTVLTYISPIKYSPFSLLVVKSANDFYGTILHFKRASYILTHGGLLLIFLCFIYIFISYKKKNDQNNLLESDLKVAAGIQKNILPPNPDNTAKDYDIYGFLRPAKSVGGDFYDFAKHGQYLHFCIGDVSGKGVPAALVMAEICSLYRQIIRSENDVQNVISSLNNAIIEHSDDSMFCTLFAAVLDLETGHLEFCNAGHNPPIFISDSTKTADFMNIKPNMPVLAFHNFPYQKGSMNLQHGDRLFLYTDGITEAKSSANTFFGTKATLQEIQRNAFKPFPESVKDILHTIKSFTKQEEQNDDITMLCVAYNNHPAERVTLAQLHYNQVKDHITDIVDGCLDICQMTDNVKLRLALEEPIQNIADYAYTDDGPLNILIEEIKGRHTFIFTLSDSGTPFNPLEQKAPDLNAPIENRKIGGLGIFLTRQIMDDITYNYTNRQNHLRLSFRIPETADN